MSRRTRPRGRRGFVVAAGWILLLLGSLSIVVWRQTRGVALERELRAIEAEQAIAAAERIELVRRVQGLASRARVVRAARERLGMRLPTDGEVVFVPVAVGGEPVPPVHP